MTPSKKPETSAHVRSASTRDLVVWEKFFNTSPLRAYKGLLEEIREELLNWGCPGRSLVGQSA